MRGTSRRTSTIPGGVPQVGGAGRRRSAITDGDRLQITWWSARLGGRRAAHRSSRRSGISAPGRPPRYAGRALNADRSAKLSLLVTATSCARLCLRLFGSPHPCSRAFIEQYDRCARNIGARRARLTCCASTSRPGRGIGIDRRVGRYTLLDPWPLRATRAGRGVLQRRCHLRHPGRVTNCLNFGSPRDPGVMWQFTQAGPRSG